MKESVIYALDFDGVICDSAVETGISGWRAAFQLWHDIEKTYPSLVEIDTFRRTRPVLGTGYEAILLVRLIYDGESVESIIENFQTMKRELITKYKLETETLRHLFGEVRDSWIKADLNYWIQKNPLFPGIAEKLQGLSEQGIWYIVTTKQERFVKQILAANQVQLADGRIFGLDRNMSKEDVLIDLQNKHANEQIYFVEDMLSNLLKIVDNSQLSSIKLFFAPWGYSTDQNKLDVQNYSIESIDFKNFLA